MEEILEIVEKISEEVESKLIEESLEKIKNTNGNRKDAPRCNKTGSYIYFLYNDLNEIIYIGESGVSVKNRIYGDGTGAHCKKEWFYQVDKLKYYIDKSNYCNYRKLLERALILKHNPKYNDGKDNAYV